MGKYRKTVDRELLLKKVNHFLSLPLTAENHDPRCSREAKAAICSLVEWILMDSDSYKGFGWNLSQEDAAAVTPDDPPYYNRVYY